MSTKTPKLEELSKTLAAKLGDTVTDGASDGQKYHSATRCAYISRAYQKLIKTLESVGVKVFNYLPDYYVTKDYEVGDVKEVIVNTTNRIQSVYYSTDERHNEYTQASKIFPAYYEKAKKGDDPNYVPSETNILWTIIDGKIKFLPEDAEITRVRTLAINDFAQFVIDKNDIVIPNNLEGLLILYAALEAHSDRGATAKYELTQKSIEQEIMLIKVANENDKIEDVS